MSMTADAFDAAALKRCFWSSTTSPFSQAERLAIADEEIAGVLYPKVIAAHADYYLTKYDQALTAGQEFYRLPPRAYGPLKDVVTVDGSGNELSVDLIDAAELGHGYGSASGGNSEYAMYFAGDFIGLRPVPTATAGTLRVRYYRHPSALCLVATAKQIGLIVAGAPGAAGADVLWNAGAVLDLITSGNAHQVLVQGAIVQSFSASLGFDFITFEAGSYDSAWQVVGDWFASTGTSPLVQLPDFMLTAAVRQVASAYLSAHGDARAPAEAKAADKLLELALSTAIPRVEGEAKVTRTRSSPHRWFR